MHLQEFVQVLPHSGHPVNYLGKVSSGTGGTRLELLLDQFAAQEAMQEALDGLHVVRTQHPAEVVVQLKVGRGTRRLVHCANDVRATTNRPSVMAG